MILRHPLLRRYVTECLVLKVFVSSHTHFLPYFLRKRKYFFRSLFSRAVKAAPEPLPLCRRQARSEAERSEKRFFRSEPISVRGVDRGKSRRTESISHAAARIR